MVTTRTILTRSAGEIRSLAWEAVADGVEHKVLWRDGDSVAGIMRFDAGAAVPEHTHHEGHHHVWVLEGRAEISGHTVGTGGYAHVPAGTPHEVRGSADGCTLLYQYLVHEAAA